MKNAAKTTYEVYGDKIRKAGSGKIYFSLNTIKTYLNCFIHVSVVFCK